MAYSEKLRQRKAAPSSLFGNMSDEEDDLARQPILTPELDQRKGKYSSAGRARADGIGSDGLLGPLTRRQLIIIVIITVIAAYYRLWNLSHPAQVVFDEVHFGKFAGKYINGTYFFDVHPPLAKMMFAAVGKLAGYDGVFDFKTIGLDYLAAKVPYYGMRLMPAFLGLLTVPICYLTVKQSGHSTAAAVLGAALVTFENSLVTQSRLILLDSPLIFFTTLTVLMWTNFGRHFKQPFTCWWWTWLALTGLGLGLTVSCKYVGLFLVAAVGVATIKQIWDLVCDLDLSFADVARQVAARALCLIVIPLTVYVVVFQIHFAVLSRTGEGAGFLSPEFQATLRGGPQSETYRDVYYGSKVHIRHDATNKGWLHSHPHNYPDGSKQQQITLYPHRDDNNVWLIVRTLEQERLIANSTEPRPALDPIRNGDSIRLLHVGTDRRLHSHDVRGPLSKADYQNEVSGYGWKGFEGDANDNWRVEIVENDTSGFNTSGQLTAINTRFRLIHPLQNCALFSNEKKLPQWGFNQTEVICMKDAKKPKSTWRIDHNVHEALPADAPKVSFKAPSLLSKVIESTRIMFSVNNGLTSSHPFESRPEHWPILRRGISFWTTDRRQIYLFGTPIVWWLSTLSLAAFIAYQVGSHFTDLRRITTKWGTVRTRYTHAAGFAFVAWFFHFAPFFLMDRQLFLHHYLPALYLAILALTYTLDALTARVSRRTRQLVFAAVFFLALRQFYQFSPLAYGSLWSRTQCEAVKWFKSWDFDCKIPPMEEVVVGTSAASAAGVATSAVSGAGFDTAAVQSAVAAVSAMATSVAAMAAAVAVGEGGAEKLNIAAASVPKAPIVKRDGQPIAEAAANAHRAPGQLNQVD
ncbi:hypothetical protein IWQ60_006926 [Tieghemiomyces parasiticus]|uniref:Dolichyl-phosphate-mannose--protein mannosyltransferase n=1 Tax=Tieghemiomyces parasiticus TaxID=78921 RepID=A0A9W8DVU1_9FUNG|nr:hypothetical protein IWQ60_006926 [Tieghemiomyces parasiticus]